MAATFRRRGMLKAMAATLTLLPVMGRWSRADDPENLPEQVVDAMNALFGKHPGFR